MELFLISMSRVLMRCNHFSLFSGHGSIQTPSFIPAATAATAAATVTASANATAAAATAATDDRHRDGAVVHAREAPDDAPRETSWSHDWRGLYAIEFMYGMITAF
jgi:hypothetical protein